MAKEKTLFSTINFSNFVNKNTIKNVVFFSGGIILFILGVIVYGLILNLREVPLSEAMIKKGFKSLQDTNIIIDRHSYSLNVYEDTVLIKSYRASFGRNTREPKMRTFDEATPVGEYSICKIDTSHKYYKFFQLNYPNLTDATEALRKNFITQKEFDQIKFEFYYEGCINSNTRLGGGVGIHGIGRFNDVLKNLPFVFNWTNGSVALSNEDIDELFTIISKGTKVVIK